MFVNASIHEKAFVFLRQDCFLSLFLLLTIVISETGLTGEVYDTCISNLLYLRKKKKKLLQKGKPTIFVNLWVVMKCDWLASNFNKAFFLTLLFLSVSCCTSTAECYCCPVREKGAAINSKHMSAPPIRFLRFAATEPKIFDWLDSPWCLNLVTTVSKIGLIVVERSWKPPCSSPDLPLNYIITALPSFPPCWNMTGLVGC